MVVMEGAGGYEILLLKHRASHQLEAAVINPRRIRDFAKGIGLHAKTDAIDAKVISRYAEVVEPQPMATKSDHEQKHGALVARRNQLLELINQESNRLKQAWDDDAKQSIRNVMDVLKDQLKDIKLLRLIATPAVNPASGSLVVDVAKCGACSTWLLLLRSAITLPSKRSTFT